MKRKITYLFAILNLYTLFSQNSGNLSTLSDDNKASNRNEQLSIFNLDLNNPNYLPARRGIGIGQDANGIVDGRFNFYIHSWQNSPSFNFISHINSNSSIENLMTINRNGVGIGANPSEKFHIEDGNIKLNLIGKKLTSGYYTGTLVGDTKISFTGIGQQFSIKKSVGPFTNYLSIQGDNNKFGIHLLPGNTNVIEFGIKTSSTDPNRQSNFQFFGTSSFSQRVKIGSKLASGAYTDCMLSVDGSIVTKEVIVQNTYWADYVFDENYVLKPIEEVKSYIINNKHLPDVPSESEIQQEGLSLSQMQKIQMQKIEELTLYIIQISEENKKLKEAIDQLTK
jgi:hypothetical protein